MAASATTGESTETSQEEGQQAPGAATEGTQPDPVALAADLDRIKRENAGLRGELKKREDAIKKAEEAQLSELEKALRRGQELEAQLAERDATASRQALHSAVVVSAARLGFNDPEDAFRLIDQESVEVGPDGHPTNVETLLADLLKAKPYMAAKSLSGGGSSNPGMRGRQVQPSDMNSIIRRQLGRE